LLSGLRMVTRGSAIHAEQAEAVRAGIAAAIDERIDWPVFVRLAHQPDRL